MVDPKDRFSFYLDSLPQDGPAGDRPAIVCEFGTAASWRRYDAELDRVFENRGAEYVDALQKLLGSRIVKYRNIPGDDLTEILALKELRLLATTLPTLADVSGPDLGNSESPSPLPAAASVGSAKPEKDGKDA